ncbi:pgsA [Symbiodinium natans]|uniref:PgsA protein n=1 Tax=Symbiodinium natans TaxID=878477 RepID=A0A812MSZ0_9DINO|nr:pgsA [Symbiodinium natans]
MATAAKQRGILRQGEICPPTAAIDQRELELLPTYHRLLQHRQEDSQCGSDDGIAVDVPAWAMCYLACSAAEMCRSAVEFNADEVHDLVQSAVTGSFDSTFDFPDEELETMPAPAARQPKKAPKPKEAPKRQLKETRWGRCLAPWCRQLALQPALGSRGPFLVCSAKNGCRFKKELSAAQWRTLPSAWQKCWPVSWAAVKPWLRPLRPVADLGAARRVRPRRISWRRAVQASQDIAASQEFMEASLSQASSAGA